MSFILLRVKLPNIARPDKSPFGIFGALPTILIALVGRHKLLNVS